MSPPEDTTPQPVTQHYHDYSTAGAITAPSRPGLELCLGVFFTTCSKEDDPSDPSSACGTTGPWRPRPSIVKRFSPSRFQVLRKLPCCGWRHPRPKACCIANRYSARVLVELFFLRCLSTHKIKDVTSLMRRDADMSAVEAIAYSSTDSVSEPVSYTHLRAHET